MNSGITLQEAQAHLQDWLAADRATAQNQSYSVKGTQFTRADAQTIRNNIKYWDGIVKQLSSGRTGPTFHRVIIRDD